MATFNPITITNAGEEILAQAVAGDGTLTFTAVSTSSDTQSGDLETITELQNIKQTVAPVIAILKDNTIQLSAVFSNSGLSQGYVVNTLGIYAKIGSEAPVLFAIATATDPDTVPGQNPISPSNFYYQFNIAITDDSNITDSVTEEGSLPASVFYQKFGSANISQIGDGTVTGAITQNANVAGGDRYDSAKSYAAGDYFIYNNQLCKALTAIASGAALTPGNNYQVTSLENEISGLNGKSEIRLTHEYFTNDILVYKKGNTVTMTYSSDINGNIPAGDMGAPFTLPEEYRPPYSVIAFTGPETNIQVRVGTDGKVKFYNYGDAITQQTKARFTLTYVVD